MNWEKVGKSLVGLLALVAVAAMLYAVLRDDDRLQARLTYAHLTYPGQFSERISQANDLLKYERLHTQISEIGAGALSHPQIDKLVDLAQAPYLQLFARPFEAGLVDHRTGLLIELYNPAQAPLKAVHIRLPAKGLVQVRDAAGNDTLVPTPTSSIDLPAIDGVSESKVWVYFDADYSQIRQGGISIRDADGSADIQVTREVVGFPALLARYSQVVVAVFAGLVLGLLAFAYAWLGRARALGTTQIL
ncbi:hypothetical protein [Pseudomonas mosselii]|uniref:Uncharacterized protein n=1 Tax=Pseudomonas mosselii TaxID=78327 RepID=A0AA42RZZ2_9PSED|nr:hypothetical protein [Pseudomonas mosselii]MDH1632312.1 hypothetical protein [Pseudomonas mosselii]